MKSFLEYVASDIIKKHGTDLSRTAVVFPNKRASLFLNTYLAQAAGRPLWSPAYITISDLFRRHSRLTVADPLKQVCDLHKCFVQCTGTDETLDHFFGWGQLLLSDFDDIDKNMADAQKVFANVRDLHELDDISYLTAEQVASIRSFFSSFSLEQNTELRRRFLMLWSKLSDVYTAFNNRLEEQGLAYEGSLYRRVVSDESVSFEYERYIFVGFNVLQKVEQRLFSRLKKEGKAKFYWDFDRYYMPHDGKADNEAGHYVASYMEAFPNELDSADGDIYGNFEKRKSITYISAPTENAQARYVGEWLKAGNRISDGRRTAIVMCDEKLLKAVIHCLPDGLEQANITTGYPLSQSPIGSFVLSLVQLRAFGYVANTQRFRLKAVATTLSHPYAPYVSPRCAELLASLTNPPVYYVKREQLCADEGTSLLFQPLDESGATPQAAALTRWIVSVLRRMGNAVNAEPEGKEREPLLEESLFRIYTLMNRLDSLIASGDLTIDVNTLQRLIAQLIQTTAIPFHGEPAVGVQIMGVLETRNIDFDHVLLLSCSDGNMPKGVGDTSFIPYSIRKAYDLTTIDNKVAIYAYYFMRLLQRASDVTIMYNNAATETSTGEMSRFMQQLLVESGHTIERKKIYSEIAPPVQRSQTIAKDERIIGLMLDRFDTSRRTDAEPNEPLLTPTAINRYLRCPLQFFYCYVTGLREQEDNAEEDMQRRLFGNIFHDAAETIYRRLSDESGGLITSSRLQALLKGKIDIERAVDEAFRKLLFKADGNATFRLELDGLQLINREVVITYLRRLIDIDSRLAPFTIVGLEQRVAKEMAISCGGLTLTTRIGGRIDRLDCVNDGTGERIRVIDYKTGREAKQKPSSVEDVFCADNLNKHSDYYLQAFVYSMIVRGDNAANSRSLPVSPALLFIQNATSDSYDPTLLLGKEPVRDIATVAEETEAKLRETVSEMFNPEVPFTPTTDADRCALCPYAQLCKA